MAPFVGAIEQAADQGPIGGEEDEEDEEDEGAVGREETTKPRDKKYDPDAKIDEEMIRKYKLAMPSTMIPLFEMDMANPDFYIYDAKKNRRNAMQRKNYAKTKGNIRKLEKEEKIVETLDEYINTLTDFKSAHSRGKMTGEGLKKIVYGKYMIDKKKLGKGVLSISYPNGKKVNGYPNKKVSEGVKKVLLNNKINKNYDLSENEKEFLRKFIGKSEADISKSKEKTLCNMTWNRCKVLLGEVQAGNTSHVFKN